MVAWWWWWWWWQRLGRMEGLRGMDRRTCKAPGVPC